MKKVFLSKKTTILVVGLVVLSTFFYLFLIRINNQVQAALTTLDISAIPTTIASGAENTVTITAYEGGSVYEDYGGKIHFTSTDATASLPSDYTFKNGTKEKAISINGWTTELQDHNYAAIVNKLKTYGVQNAYLGVFETTAIGTQNGNLFSENDFNFASVTTDDYYDLTDFINAAAAQNINVYAWITIFGPEQKQDIDGDGRLEYTWVDPASTEHLTFINILVSHLLTNYNGLSGIVIDYIRYADPASANQADGDNIDEAQYRVYKDGGSHQDYSGNFTPINAETYISNVVQSIAQTVHGFAGKKIAAEVFSAHTQSLYDTWVKPKIGQDYALMAPNLDFIIPLAYHIGWYGPDWVAEVVDFVYGKVNPSNPSCEIWPKVHSYQEGKEVQWPGPGEMEEATDDIDYAKVGGLGFYVYDQTSDAEWAEIRDSFDDNGTKTFSSNIQFNQTGTFDIKIEDLSTGISDAQTNIEVFAGHANGSLIKTASSPAAYFIKNGYKSLIISPSIFSSRFRWNQYVTVTPEELSKYPNHPTESNLHFREGTLFRLSGNPTVYVVEEGQKRAIDTAATFTSKGYRWSNIILAENQSILDAHQDSSALTSSSILPNGTLIKENSSASVFFLENGKKRYIPSATIFTSQFHWQDIVIVASSTMNSYSVGKRCYYRNGSIIKHPFSSSIYFIENEKRRKFPSASEYIGEGFSWDDYVVSESNLILDRHITGNEMEFLLKYIGIYGDSRNGHATHQKIVAGLRGSKPKIVLHTGDMVNLGSNTSDWDMLNSIINQLRLESSFYPSVGNHDLPIDNYLANFELPNNERWYSAEIGRIHYIALDSTQPITPESQQYIWLQSDLSNISSDVLFTVVFLHHPPIVGGDLYTYAIPLFETYGVDIVFNGHQHRYERSYYHNIYYITTGGGGAPLVSASPPNPYSQKVLSTYNFCRMIISNNKLKVDVFDNDLNLIDQFETS